MNKITSTTEQGFALILALIISSVVLAIGLTLLDVTVKQLNLGTTSRQSEVAFQAAAAGLNCLQRMRNVTYAFDTKNGNNVINARCLGMNINLNDLAPAPNVRHYYPESTPGIPGLDWDPSGSGNPRCIEIEMYVLDATSGQISYTIAGQNRTCPVGGVCTFGFSRARNNACGAPMTDLFLVQRELTAEF